MFAVATTAKFDSKHTKFYNSLEIQTFVITFYCNDNLFPLMLSF